MTTSLRSALVLTLGLASFPAMALAGSPNSALVTFSSGAQGWSLNGWNTITQSGGNPGARIFWNNFVDTFGMAARNSTNAAFIGDYTAKGPVTLSIDYKVTSISFFGTPVSRTLVAILYDDDGFEGAPPAAVWTEVGTLPGTGLPWTTFSAAVSDVLSAELPAGWNGAGAEDPVTFEPILPKGRTWTNVLQGVDRIEFTTLVPGFFYGFTNFNLSIDNVAIAPQAVPCPADLDADGSVGASDLAVLLAAWGGTGPADLDGGGEVGAADLTILLGAWGACGG
jgi:hypothetical protein